MCIPKKVLQLGWLNQEEEELEVNFVYQVTLGCTVIEQANFTFLSTL